MKLDYKKTILVGFAFFLISAFWQAYDTIVPLILTNKFEMNQTWSGVIMSLDNVFAVVLLPIFGALSDKVSTRYGKRTPFIIVGTILASIFFVLLGVSTTLALFIGILLMALLSMAIFRSPAVALMPDVTLKPLRSKGNAIINLMGTAGGMIVLAFGMVFNTSAAGKTDFTDYMLAVAIVMLVALFIFVLTVKENEWAKEMEEKSQELGIDAQEAEEEGEKRPLSKSAYSKMNRRVDKPATAKVTVNNDKKLSRGEFISLILILASVALWYIGYNSITSKYSVYASNVLKVPYTVTLLVAQAAAIISYIPVGMVASRIGRKKTILAGVVMLTAAFFFASFIKEGTSEILMYALFCLAGIGWATINVNSFPMVVELAKGGNVGKYTGFYYTASMAAQIVTPVLAGFCYDTFGWWIFFPYAAFFAGCAFLTMMFVRHGDAKPSQPKDKMEMLGGADD